MLHTEAQDILRRLVQNVPQFEYYLEQKLQAELSGLPNASLDKVQVFQGRCLLLQELLREVRHASGPMANRTAKPNFSTP